MQSPFHGSNGRTTDDGLRLDASADSSLHVLSGAHGCNLGNLTANIAGRDVIQYITDNSGRPAHLRVPDSIQSQRDAILRNLTAPTFDAPYKFALEQRMAQTGSWFLESRDFLRFVGMKGVTLWCTGMPGAGKTILASTAVEHLRTIAKQSPHVAVAFAFLRYSEHHPWRDILSSLLVQLIKKSDIACAIFWPHYSRAAADATSELVISEYELEMALRDIAPKLEQLYVVVDGLDEAPDEVKDRLLENLVSADVNLLILSRPLDIYTHHAPNALFISIQAETKDIELYVRGEVQRSSRLKSIFQAKPERISELCEKIAEQSNGMFLVARLQMGAIMRSSNSIASLFSNLKALPAGINAMYDLTLSRIRDSEDSSIAFRVFACVAHRAHSQIGAIPADILQRALSFNQETNTFDSDDIIPLPLIIYACQGLLIRDHYEHSSHDTVRFVHYTTHQYIKAAKLDTENGHSLLDVTCFACMEDHREVLLHLCRTNQPQAVQVYVQDTPLLEFSHRYWRNHATSALFRDYCPNVHPLFSKHKEYPVILSTENCEWRTEILAGANLAVTYDLIGDGAFPQNAKGLPEIKSVPGGYTPFHLAAMCGRFETFQLLLSSSNGVNTPSHDGSTVLHIAIAHDQTTFIQQLHDFMTITQSNDLGFEKFCFNVNSQDSKGVTPLMLAIRRKNEQLVKLFLSCPGVDCHIYDMYGASAFHYCVDRALAWCGISEDAGLSDRQRWDNIAKMMSSMPHTNLHPCQESTFRIFERACGAGFVATVEHIWATCKGDPSLIHRQIGKRRETALMVVCGSPAYEGWGPIMMDIFDLLVTHGSDLRAQNILGMTPFMYAIERHAAQAITGGWYLQEKTYISHPLELSRRLLALDPTLINQRDYRGRTALILAVETTRHLKPGSTVQWILERKGGDLDFINAEDKSGKSALVHACSLGGVEVATALLALPGIKIPHLPESNRWLEKVDWISPPDSDDRRIERRMVEVTAAAMYTDPSLVWKGFAFSARRATSIAELRALSSVGLIWQLDNNDTITLLAHVALKRPSSCRVPIALVLVLLNLLPWSTFKLEKNGAGVCGKDPCPHGKSFNWEPIYPLVGALKGRFHETNPG